MVDDEALRELAALAGVVLGQDDLRSALTEITRIAARSLPGCGRPLDDHARCDRAPPRRAPDGLALGLADELQYEERVGTLPGRRPAVICFRVRDLRTSALAHLRPRVLGARRRSMAVGADARSRARRRRAERLLHPARPPSTRGRSRRRGLAGQVAVASPAARSLLRHGTTRATAAGDGVAGGDRAGQGRADGRRALDAERRSRPPRRLPALQPQAAGRRGRPGRRGVLRWLKTVHLSRDRRADPARPRPRATAQPDLRRSRHRPHAPHRRRPGRGPGAAPTTASAWRRRRPGSWPTAPSSSSRRSARGPRRPWSARPVSWTSRRPRAGATSWRLSRRSCRRAGQASS